jgi:hypothetical protein
MAYTRQNTQAVKDFLQQCVEMKVDVRKAALQNCDITYYGHFMNFPRMRQIRKVKDILAQAFEPELGNWIVLTKNREILCLTSEEANQYK